MVKSINEELIRQCAREAEEGTRGASVGEVREAAELAIRLYHDRVVAPLVEAAEEYMAADGEVDATVCNPLFAKRADLDARDAAVERKRRAFGQLRTALAAFGDAPAPEPPLAPEVRALVEALKPFALIAEMDIGDDETDADLFRPLTRHNHAPHIRVGHLRAALKALTAIEKGEG